jgi:hypothetical protein
MVVAGNAYGGCLVHVAQTWYRCVWGTISIGCWILNAQLLVLKSVVITLILLTVCINSGVIFLSVLLKEIKYDSIPTAAKIRY